MASLILPLYCRESLRDCILFLTFIHALTFGTLTSQNLPFNNNFHHHNFTSKRQRVTLEIVTNLYAQINSNIKVVLLLTIEISHNFILIKFVSLFA